MVANETDNAIVITDKDGLIQYVNQGFTKLTEYSLEEVRGKKPGHFLQGAAHGSPHRGADPGCRQSSPPDL
nr:PAS domain-containing protein [Pseudomonas lundensis]